MRHHKTQLPTHRITDDIPPQMKNFDSYPLIMIHAYKVEIFILLFILMSANSKKETYKSLWYVLRQFLEILTSPMRGVVSKYHILQFLNPNSLN